MQSKFLALAITAFFAASFTASAATTEQAKRPVVLAQAKIGDAANEPVKKTVVEKTNVKNVKPIKNGGTRAIALSTWDCKKVGTVVETDGRCGASHQYCQVPGTGAVCIDSRN